VRLTPLSAVPGYNGDINLAVPNWLFHPNDKDSGFVYKCEFIIPRELSEDNSNKHFIEFNAVNFVADIAVSAKDSPKEAFAKNTQSSLSKWRHIGGWMPFSVDLKQWLDFTKNSYKAGTKLYMWVIIYDRNYSGNRLTVTINDIHHPNSLDLVEESEGKVSYNKIVTIDTTKGGITTSHSTLDLNWPIGDKDKFHGIIDDIWLRSYVGVRVKNCQITTAQTNGLQWEATARYEIEKLTDKSMKVNIKPIVSEGWPHVPPNSNPSNSMPSPNLTEVGMVNKGKRNLTVTFADGEKSKVIEAKWIFDSKANIKPWELWKSGHTQDTRDNMLYSLKTKFTMMNDGSKPPAAGDSSFTDMRSFGFRTVKIVNGTDVQKPAITINNRPVTWFGDNIRFSSTPHLRVAYTFDAFQKDVRKLQSLGINIIRFHKQGAPQWAYDLCDRMGMCIEAEACINTADLGEVPFNSAMENNGYIGNCTSYLNEWIRDHYRHPSAVLWSAGNELTNFMTKDQTTTSLKAARANFIKSLAQETLKVFGDLDKNLVAFHESAATRILASTPPEQKELWNSVADQSPVYSQHYPFRDISIRAMPNGNAFRAEYGVNKVKRFNVLSYVQSGESPVRKKPLMFNEFMATGLSFGDFMDPSQHLRSNQRGQTFNADETKINNAVLAVKRNYLLSSVAIRQMRYAGVSFIAPSRTLEWVQDISDFANSAEPDGISYKGSPGITYGTQIIDANIVVKDIVKSYNWVKDLRIHNVINAMRPIAIFDKEYDKLDLQNIDVNQSLIAPYVGNDVNSLDVMKHVYPSLPYGKDIVRKFVIFNNAGLENSKINYKVTFNGRVQTGTCSFMGYEPYKEINLKFSVPSKNMQLIELVLEASEETDRYFQMNTRFRESRFFQIVQPNFSSRESISNGILNMLHEKMLNYPFYRCSDKGVLAEDGSLSACVDLSKMSGANMVAGVVVYGGNVIDADFAMTAIQTKNVKSEARIQMAKAITTLSGPPRIIANIKKSNGHIYVKIERAAGCINYYTKLYREDDWTSMGTYTIPSLPGVTPGLKGPVTFGFFTASSDSLVNVPDVFYDMNWEYEIPQAPVVAN